MMQRKAQAAMEFLMTYGWAILVVLAAVGALAYFGVFDTSNLLPEDCTVGTGWQCDNDVIRSDGVDFRLENNLQTSVRIEDMTFSANDCSAWDAPTLTTSDGAFALGDPLDNREQLSVSATCSGGDVFSGRTEVDISVTFQESGESVNRTMSGTIARAAQ